MSSSSSLPGPFAYLYNHVTIFSDHVIKTIDGLYEVWEDSQVSFTDPETSPINSPPPSIESEFESEASAFHSQVGSTMKDILSGKITPPSGSPVTADTGPNGFKEAFEAFTSAIDFTKDGYWLSLLLTFHVITFVAIIKTRRQTNVQITIFIILAILTIMTERINTYLAESYISPGTPVENSGILSTFASQNYFDDRGIFASIFFAGPMLVNCAFLVMCLVWEAKDLLIEVKREEFRRARIKKESGGKKKGKKKRE
ncbi:hypothetical protein TL16_g13132 [Triparma laevis f. inornata]|uniref:Transmembrane protein 18 n=1 Tax=Triparma laevis f. inornata TaxID=1714386 RepID=A0A9W7EYQ8_9STRA|nr:hypothetical protein TL16_g13132 [Triparma laevis f. inornata]